MHLALRKTLESKDPEKLFDLEIAIMKERSCFNLTLQSLKRQRTQVLEKATNTVCAEGHIPFLPAIPRIHFGAHAISWLISMVKIDGTPGHSELLHNSLSDHGMIPNHPYWIFDVHVGTETHDEDLYAMHAIMTELQRMPLTTTEIISLCMISGVLSEDRAINATGSRYQGIKIPQLRVYKNRPVLGTALSFRNSSTPSCGSR